MNNDLSKFAINFIQEIMPTATSDEKNKHIEKLVLYMVERDHTVHSKQIPNTVITGETSDGYHTFNELYEFRMLYNAAFFNIIDAVCKSWKHSDGELCFGGGWFVVSAQLPTGQITNHYEAKNWDLFKIPEVEKAPEWDGHTPQDVIERLRKFIELW